jgi:rSAM/selenodomain-associated transferase 2
MKRADISVIVPVFHEEEAINRAVDALYGLIFDGRLEIIVVDGDPEKQTLNVIRDQRVIKANSAKGRGKQMNKGALLASGDVLLFLHADTQLPPDGLTRIWSVMRDGICVGGGFDLGLQSDKFCFRLIEKAASIRSRITRIPYGDQALFLRKDFFLNFGGFSDMPLMEDVDLMRRVRRSKGKIQIIGEKVKTSARRWEKEGVLYCTLRNWTLIVLYLFGVSPQKLARFYRDHQEKQVGVKEKAG